MDPDIYIELDDGTQHHAGAPGEAGRWLAGEIAARGFQGVFVQLGVVEFEWTDPDLWLEVHDVEYFHAQGVPLAFVKEIFVNWRQYAAALRQGGRLEG